MKKSSWLAAVSGALALSSLSALGTDYYVKPDGDDANDGLSSSMAFATVDKAITAATASADVIHVAPGTYSTTTQYGPNLKSKLIGTGASRDEVVIESSGTYRTLRMAAGSWLENVTIVGEGTYQADKGGGIEMNGGTVTNCVLRDGTAVGNDSYNAGGNIYVNATAALVVDCVITGGTTKNRGGNVCLDNGTVRNCVISGGSIPEKKNSNAQQHGGNVFSYKGRIENCTITGGSAERAGNVYLYDAAAVLADSTVSGGTGDNHGGNIFQRNGVVTNCVVSGGTATANSGGNIHIQNGSVMDSTVCGGSAKVSGGNIYMTGGAVSDCDIYNGSAEASSWDHGGGNVFANPGRLTRCKIHGGTVAGNKGGGIRSRNASTVIEDCLVYGNPNGGVCLEGKGTHYNNTIVNNGAYGIWGYGSNPGTFVNCILYGNMNGDAVTEWTGNHPAAADMYNCAFDQDKLKGSVDITTYAGSVYLADSSAFVDYANGDYHIVAGSDLQDAGAVDNRANASTLDLDGNPRQSGTIDIGCYEYQKPDMTVRIDGVSYSQLFAPATVTFTHGADNSADPSTLRFTYDFGDGSAQATTTETSIPHEYANPGVYTVTITAASDCEDDVPVTQVYADYVTVLSQYVYANPGNANAAFPYDTPETGYATVAMALAASVDGSEIRLVDGIYDQSAKLSVNKAVTIIGNTVNPEAVVLRNTATAANGSGDKRVMAIDNAGALVTGLTLQNGQIYHQLGGNLAISAGMISNCVIRGGVAIAGTDAEFGMGAGVSITGSGVVSHCVITNNETQGASSGKWVQGGAVVFPWGSSGKLLNSLVAYNRWTIESETANGSAGILYHGSTTGSRVENCTVVANQIVGTCGPSCAAGIRCDWNSSIRNTVIVGNRIGQTVSNVFLAQNGEGAWQDGLNTCVTEDALPSGNASCRVASLAETFADFAHGNYQPLPGGALFDKGIDPTYAGASFDLAGKPRVTFSKIDIGCYECDIQPATVVIFR